jgi:polyisoprenyl-phosphate glycosyltransferase
MPQISVVVPCLNESEVIETFHTTLLAVLGPAVSGSFEVCYVDDGSDDGTAGVLRRLAAADHRVRYTSFSRNFGKEAAILAGLRAARGGAVVLMDADLQHPPALLPRMLELHRLGYDQVVARRDRTGEGRLRTALSRLYYRLVRHCTDVDVRDGAGDFRLLSRRAADALLALPESNRFSKGLYSWIGFDTVCFPYANERRAAGRSRWAGRRLLDYGIDGLLSFNTRPLRLAVHAGLWLVLSALAYALWIVVNVLVSGVETPGYATLITAMTGLAGIQIATLGVIGEYVGRIYHESKRRPHYVVRETDADGAVPPAPPVFLPPVTEPPGLSVRSDPLAAPAVTAPQRQPLPRPHPAPLPPPEPRTAAEPAEAGAVPAAPDPPGPPPASGGPAERPAHAVPGTGAAPGPRGGR